MDNHIGLIIAFGTLLWFTPNIIKAISVAIKAKKELNRLRRRNEIIQVYSEVTTQLIDKILEDYNVTKKVKEE